MLILSVKKLECGRCCLRGENNYFYLVSLLKIGPIRLFAFEAGPIKLLVSGRLCMSSSGYLVEDIFFCQRSEGTSIIYLQAILVPVLTNITLNHLKVGCREGP